MLAPRTGTTAPGASEVRIAPFVLGTDRQRNVAPPVPVTVPVADGVVVGVGVTGVGVGVTGVGDGVGVEGGIMVR